MNNQNQGQEGQKNFEGGNAKPGGGSQKPGEKDKNQTASPGTKKDDEGGSCGSC